MKALAIACWVAAWFFAGLIPASLFAAKNGDARRARAGFAAGLLGAAGFTLIGLDLW